MRITKTVKCIKYMNQAEFAGGLNAKSGVLVRLIRDTLY